MSYEKQNFKSGAKLKASQLNAMDNELYSLDESMETKASASDVEELKSDTANLKSDTTSLKDNLAKDDRRITNLEFATKGILYREESDDTEAYSKDIPSDAMPFGTFDNIGGKSVVLNQNNLAFESTVTKSINCTKQNNGFILMVHLIQTEYCHSIKDLMLKKIISITFQQIVSGLEIMNKFFQI